MKMNYGFLCKNKTKRVKDVRLFGKEQPLVGWLFGFYSISTFVGHLMPNPFSYKQSVLFQTILFSMSTQFNCQKHFYFKLFSLFKQF